MNYKDKISKLLALAQSPEEAEAKEALLKARKLMAEHKLTEADLEDDAQCTVKDVRTNITCSKRRNPWIVNLVSVIGESYCCKGYRVKYPGKQTQTIAFIGLADDVEVCIEIFRYAVSCVLSEVRRIRKKNKSYNANYVRSLCDSYGYGFCAGVQKAFAKQEAENSELGLILSVPKVVQQAAQHLVRRPFIAKTQSEISPSEYKRGYIDGKKFDPQKVFKGESVA